MTLPVMCPPSEEAAARRSPPAAHPAAVIYLRPCASCGHVGGGAARSRRTRAAPLPRHRPPDRAALTAGESWRWCYLDETIV